MLSVHMAAHFLFPFFKGHYSEKNIRAFIPKGRDFENITTIFIPKNHYSENNIRVVIPSTT